jgi:hypothetical protein
MELSALVGHVLSVYQRRYAAEAYISTAQAPSSLIRHAHRLAYDPDPGLAASGYVVLFTKDLVNGTVPAGFPLASVPLGDIKAQHYETREALAVDAVLNELLPARAQRPTVIAADAQSLRLEGIGHGLEVGAPIAFVGPEWWRGFIVEEVLEEAGRNATVIRLDQAVGREIAASALDPHRVLAQPAIRLRPFGANADAVLFPPVALRNATGTVPVTSGTKHWYEVQRPDGGGYNGLDLYLSEQVAEPLRDRVVLRSTGSQLAVFHVAEEVVASVTVKRQEAVPFTRETVTLAPVLGGGFSSVLTASQDSLPVTSHFSGTVTAIRVAGRDGVQALRPTHPVPAEWLTGWGVEAAVAARVPNPEPLAEPLELPGILPALAPGRPLAFTNLAETASQIVTIRRVELDEGANETRVWWDAVTQPPEGGWQLDDLKVFGNVARVSHGRTVEEILGGSDGVSAFQRFPLGESPVTILPGVEGGEPELEVRVDDVLWERVQDFAESGPDDRHYRSVTDAERVTLILFGDGRSGAVPPSGRKNVAAVYRVHLGRAGDVEPRRLSRIKRAHPLLDRAVNVTPVTGGAEPADGEAIRSQATRWIRTFDRAVSVSDLADLALTMPGIARAASRWDQARGAVLVVATPAGGTPPALDAVRAFLDARRDTSVPLELVGPRPLAVRITVEVEPDPAYLVEIVLDAVRKALHGEDEHAPGMFTFPARGLGQPAFRSEVYARLEALTGVVGVQVDRFESDTSGSAAEVVIAEVDEWLRLDPTDLTVATAVSARVA